MRLLDRYLFREWLKAFALSLAVTLGILVVEDVQDDLPDFLSWGASAPTILKYYAIYIPTFLPTLIPVALLVSVLFTLGNMHRNNEIVAMRAGGLTLFGITRSLWVAGLLLAGALFYLNAQVVPQSIEQARAMRENLAFRFQAERGRMDQVGILLNLTYDNNLEGRRWMINRFSQYYSRGFGITIYQLDEKERETARILAAEGIYDDTVGHWILEDGREIRFDPETGEPVYSQAFEERAYPQFGEVPALMQTLSKPAEDLSLYEIDEVLSQVSPEVNPRAVRYEVRYQSILASPFVCLIVVGIAVPFAVAGVRVNPVVGVTKSAGLFLAYYALASLARLLGEQGRIDPLLAAWLPIGTMLLLALLLLRKVR